MAEQNFFGTLVEVTVEIHRIETLLAPEEQKIPVTSLQLSALRVLYFGGAMSLSGLCECLGVSLPNGSREIKHLAELGLVSKQPDTQDKRLVKLRVTPEGQEFIQKSFQMMEEKFRSLTAGWPEALKGDMAQVLTRLLPHLKRLE